MRCGNTKSDNLHQLAPAVPAFHDPVSRLCQPRQHLLPWRFPYDSRFTIAIDSPFTIHHSPFTITPFSETFLMFNPFKPLELIETEVFTSLPGKFRNKVPQRVGRRQPAKHSDRMFPRRPGLRPRRQPLSCATSRSAASSASTRKATGIWSIQYDGWPNGMKFHKDGRLFICDYKDGLLALDVKTGKLENDPAHRLQRELQGPERPALHVERRPLLHRPGPDRHRRSDRPRVTG